MLSMECCQVPAACASTSQPTVAQGASTGAVTVVEPGSEALLPCLRSRQVPTAKAIMSAAHPSSCGPP
jgi:hypothetical protein